MLVLPDIIANAGGVISAAVEYAGGTRADAFSTIDERVRANTTAMLERSIADDVSPRRAALTLARQRLDAAVALRRFA